MPIVTFGNESSVLATSAPTAPASLESARSALVTDLRSTFDLLDRLGVRRQMCGSKEAKAGVLFTAAGTRLLIKGLGLPTTLRILAMLNNLSDKHRGYLARLESDKGERMRLRGQMLLSFADVKPMGPVSAATAKAAPEAAASASVMGAWGPLILAGAAAGAGIYMVVRALFRRKDAPEKALLMYFRARRMHVTTKDEDSAAATLASSMYLPRTAVAITDGTGLSGLPDNELWPKTQIPVATYVRAWLDINAPVVRTSSEPYMSGAERISSKPYGSNVTIPVSALAPQLNTGEKAHAAIQKAFRILQKAKGLIGGVSKLDLNVGEEKVLRSLIIQSESFLSRAARSTPKNGPLATGQARSVAAAILIAAQTLKDVDGAQTRTSFLMEFGRTVLNMTDKQHPVVRRNIFSPDPVRDSSTLLDAWRDSTNGSGEEDMSGVEAVKPLRRRPARVTPADPRSTPLLRLTMPELVVKAGPAKRVMCVSPPLSTILRSLDAWKVQNGSRRL